MSDSFSETSTNLKMYNMCFSIFSNQKQKKKKKLNGTIRLIVLAILNPISICALILAQTKSIRKSFSFNECFLPCFQKLILTEKKNYIS